MSTSIDDIKNLREITGVSMTECKKALEEANGDQEKAIELLRKRGMAKAVDKKEREAKEGIITSYIHSNHKLGVLVELNCETDFVAKNEDFIRLANDIAMQVAATNPECISPDEVSESLIAKEREIWTAQLAKEGKPANIIDKIMEGKEKKFREEQSLLTQNFVKNPEITIEKLISDVVGKLGENIKVKRFARFAI
ncbi:translation elongation factor Ts [Candidatus Peregrinibacteria bacterium RIFOXYC2_FULL_33_13]|nr:MAG: Elongation factor Ts [Candidatus Peregrinibacteria bacterium GW2011_GWA2_33_10]KKP39754.1 MAG: elongation factor Ts, elongation factor Ts [Candidatus Peregrinibacteria bacterium GW2011_GWC2_33_13]OGJ50442.1 MAG: translation elongation factor Ts [Candidatus Peregrinibacteria bacterium RIFOXYA2_FULL_33_7]OGJ52097.1 MAG: translation elongation factor Ts [Candidatus Peregrinibacteria bacterium RIFOXYC2_FULL_33_13]